MKKNGNQSKFVKIEKLSEKGKFEKYYSINKISGSKYGYTVKSIQGGGGFSMETAGQGIATIKSTGREFNVITEYGDELSASISRLTVKPKVFTASGVAKVDIVRPWYYGGKASYFVEPKGFGLTMDLPYSDFFAVPGVKQDLIKPFAGNIISPGGQPSVFVGVSVNDKSIGLISDNSLFFSKYSQSPFTIKTAGFEDYYGLDKSVKSTFKLKGVTSQAEMIDKYANLPGAGSLQGRTNIQLREYTQSLSGLVVVDKTDTVKDILSSPIIKLFDQQRSSVISNALSKEASQVMLRAGLASATIGVSAVSGSLLDYPEELLTMPPGISAPGLVTMPGVKATPAIASLVVVKEKQLISPVVISAASLSTKSLAAVKQPSGLMPGVKQLVVPEVTDVIKVASITAPGVKTASLVSTQQLTLPRVATIVQSMPKIAVPALIKPPTNIAIPYLPLLPSFTGGGGGGKRFSFNRLFKTSFYTPSLTSIFKGERVSKKRYKELSAGLLPKWLFRPIIGR